MSAVAGVLAKRYIEETAWRRRMAESSPQPPLVQWRFDLKVAPNERAFYLQERRVFGDVWHPAEAADGVENILRSWLGKREPAEREKSLSFYVFSRLKPPRPPSEDGKFPGDPIGKVCHTTDISFAEKEK